MKLSILFPLCLFTAQTAFAANKFTNNLAANIEIVAAATANITNLQTRIDHALNPELTLGKSVISDKGVVGKAVCASLGEAVGYANAAFDGISRYNISSNNKVDQFPIDSIKNELDNMIYRLSSVRNGYCLGRSNDYAKETPVFEGAKVSADYIAYRLTEVKGKQKARD